MAVAYDSAGAGNGTETNLASLDVVCPATITAGDILIAHVIYTGTATGPSTPNGWTALYGPADVGTTATARHWVFGKIAIGDEDGTTISFGTAGGTEGRAGRIYRFTGRVSGTIASCVPSASFSTIAHATDPQGPEVTTTLPGALAIALMCQDDNNTEEAVVGMTGGTWGGHVEYSNATWGPQGIVLYLNTCTPTANPGTVTGGAMVAANDEAGTIGFEIRHSSATPPTCTLGTPDDDATITDTTPALTFTGTDTDEDTIEYQVQVDTAVGFDSTYQDLIAHDADSMSTLQTTSPATVNHTVTGANTLLVVGVNLKTSTSQGSVSEVTYNGVAMTKATSKQFSGDAYYETSIWFLHAPTTGTNQISATFSGGTSPFCWVAGSSYTGAQQNDTADAVNSTSGAGSSGDKTLNVTTVANNTWIYSIAGLYAGTASLTADQTQRSSYLSGNYGVMSEDTNSALPVGNNTVGFTIGGTSVWDYTICAASFCSSTSAPLLSKLSNIDTTEFSDSSPHTSGVETTYTVPDASALTASASPGTTYYWRVRATDPLGSNTYGAWSPGDSTLGYDHFHLVSGGVVAQATGYMTNGRFWGV